MPYLEEYFRVIPCVSVAKPIFINDSLKQVPCEFTLKNNRRAYGSFRDQYIFHNQVFKIRTVEHIERICR